MSKHRGAPWVFQSSATPLETHQEEEGMGLMVTRLDTGKLSPTT